jgi:hypothetical protein
VVRKRSTISLSHHVLVPFPEERGENVLAGPVAPEVVPTIAARMRCAIKIHPVFLGAAREVVLSFADTVSLEREAPLETTTSTPSGLAKSIAGSIFFTTPSFLQVPRFKRLTSIYRPQGRRLRVIHISC